MSFALTPSAISPAPSIILARSLPQGVDELQQMGPMELFQSQMETGSTEAKVDAMKRLPVVAYAMGASETCSKLLPYLQTLANNTTSTGGSAPQPLEDELLLLLAKQVQTLSPALLTETSQMMQLVPILERLASVEETVVREQAVIAMNNLCTALAGSSAKTVSSETGASLLAVAKRLASADWFTPKVSAAGMLPSMYHITKIPELAVLYKDLCQDETPMVRRSAANHLGAMLKELGGKDKANDLIPVLQALCKDEQDSVRMLAVASLGNVGPSYGKSPEWTKEYLLPLLKDGSTDLSWRVRHNLSKHFSDVATNLGFSGNSNYSNDQSLVMACFVSLLTDMEAEVRAAAVAHFANMVHWGGSALFQQHLGPLLPALADDVVMEVRSKCASAIMDSSVGGTLTDTIILQSFGPLLESFLQDEFQEVQLQVLGNLHKLSHLLEKMETVTNAIINMAKSTNWRVREGVAKLLPHLAQAKGSKFFEEQLLQQAWLVLLLDPVASVRAACVVGMKILVKSCGVDWMVQTILPHHVRIYSHAASGSYLVRITILQAHAATAVACSETSNTEGSLWNDVVHHVVQGLNDKVPNVRMVAAHGLADICAAAEDPSQKALVDATIAPALQKKVSEEEDMDVRYACEGALANCSK